MNGERKEAFLFQSFHTAFEVMSVMCCGNNVVQIVCSKLVYAALHGQTVLVREYVCSVLEYLDNLNGVIKALQCPPRTTLMGHRTGYLPIVVSL